MDSESCLKGFIDLSCGKQEAIDFPFVNWHKNMGMYHKVRQKVVPLHNGL